MNGGKDIKIGHDKRPISVVPSDEQPLYNIANGEVLTDEFGNELVTEVDQFFIGDSTMARSTSVVFPLAPKDTQPRRLIQTIGIATGTYGVNFDAHVIVTQAGFAHTALPVNQVNGNVVGVGTTTPGEVNILRINIDPSTNEQEIVKLANFPQPVEIRTVNDQGGNYNHIYFDEDNIPKVANVTLPTSVKNHKTQYVIKVTGGGIPSGTFVTKKSYDRITLSNNVIVGAGGTTERLEFTKITENVPTQVDNVLKVEEIFRETSEVSTTLLGIDRAETQLSLFSNVSSYGLNSDEWEAFTFTSGISFSSWENRINELYGKRFTAKIDERTVESAITLESFPPPYSYPFGPKFDKIGIYRPELYPQYLNFIRFGNNLYKLFSEKLAGLGYPSTWNDKFLNPLDVRPLGVGNAAEVYYNKLTDSNDNPDPTLRNSFDYAFSKIDKWTDTYRDIARGSSLKDPITGENLSFASLNDKLGSSSIGTGEVLTNIYDSGNTRPGYQTNYRRFCVLQSRRVFRYQPGRISGFTFGSRASTEPVPGMANEWGIANKTDQYMFKIYGGQLSIIRRSKILLSNDVLIRNGLDPAANISVNISGTTYNTVQPYITSGDPFDNEQYWTVEIPRDKFNGDPLNGNGPSGYTIRPEKVTMWKIEFGWYGAIGARFYAYIPVGAGEARWITVHTLVIENQLGQPCLQDSYFRFKYLVNIFDTTNIRTPQYIYKYGASYYIDGGDEGTSEQFSTGTGLAPKQINRTAETALIGVRPKDVILNSTGVEIANRKLIIPTKLSVSSDSLSEVKVKTCKACPGFGHVFTPGVGTTVSGRTMNVSFDTGNLITTVGSGVSFTDADIGAKIIAPSLFNAYITEMDQATATSYPNGFKTYTSAIVKGYGGLDGYPDYSDDREIGGSNSVIDYGLTDPITGVGGSSVIAVGTGEYPHEIRLSNYDVHFASSYPIYGSEITIQFVNPVNKDGISSYKSNTHWADFLIGVTDKKPSIQNNNLNGWHSDVLSWTDYSNIAQATIGSGNTSILPNNEILFGQSTHSWAAMNEDGYEYGESWAPTDVRVRMGIDFRIPTIANPGGGICSKLDIKVANPVPIGVNVKQLYQQNPETEATDINEGYYLKIENGEFSSGINDWPGGQVVNRDNTTGIINVNSKIKFEKTFKPNISVKNYTNEEPNAPLTYIDQGIVYSYIKISDDLGAGASNITIMGRPVTLEGRRLNSEGGTTPKVKLFKYNVFPLYLVGKLKDKAQINNISIKEIIGESQKTTSPELAVTTGSFGEIDNAGGNADITGVPPTNFRPVKRLSSSEVDTQNQQRLRPSITKDIFYVGKNSTKEIDMTKVFGIDRNVITPDNLNLEATFLTAKKLDGDNVNNTGNIQLTLNYKEQ